MNTEDLRKAVFELNLSEFEAMNMQQDQGIISDLCVWLVDIHERDIPKAIAYLYEATRKSSHC